MDVPLLGENRTRDVQKFLVFIALFAIPFAASQITLYDLLFEVSCMKNDISPGECTRDPAVAKQVGSLLSAVAVMNGLVTMLVSIVLNTYTDRAGRKMGLLWFMALTTLGIFAYPACAYWFSSWTPWRMLFPYFLTALGGSPSLMLNQSVLYITDLLPHPRTRTEYLSFLIGTVMSVQAIAPGVGGVLLGSVSVSHYLYGCALLMALATLVFYRFVESDKRDAESVSLSLKDSYELATFGNSEHKWNARIVFVNFLVSNMCAVGFLDLIMVYAKHTFQWLGSDIGANMFRLFSIRTLWAILGFPLLYGQLTKMWPASASTVDLAELVHMYACNILTIFGYIALARAQTSSEYSRGLIVLANDAIVGPVWINALMKHVDPTRKGEFMAALSVIGKPVEAFLPAAMMKILTLSLDTWPQLAFYVTAGLIAALLCSQLFIKVDRPT